VAGQEETSHGVDGRGLRRLEPNGGCFFNECTQILKRMVSIPKTNAIVRAAPLSGPAPGAGPVGCLPVLERHLPQGSWPTGPLRSGASLPCSPASIRRAWPSFGQARRLRRSRMATSRPVSRRSLTGSLSA
jgi:hypothetical protein